MNIDHLTLFVRLAATHNISQAGHELGLSPAVASSHINKLEASLGTRLVHRTTRKVALTEEGEAFLPHAEEILNTVAAAQASVGAGELRPRGTLRISAPASFGRMHLIPALQEFMTLNPELRIDCRLSDTMVDLVEGGFDVAIRNAELKDSSLVARKLADDKRIVCASPDYLTQYGTPLHPADLVKHQLITLSGLDSWCFTGPNGIETIKAKGHFKADNGEAIRDASIHGLGITIGSTWSISQYLHSGALVPILQDYPLASKTAIWAVYPSSRLLAPKVRTFIDFFSQYYSSPPYWDVSTNTMGTTPVKT